MSNKKKKKQERVKVFFGIFVTVIMITSLGGFFVNNQNSSDGTLVTIDGKEYSFVPNQRSFSVKSEFIGGDVEMFFYPSDLQSIDFPDAIGKKLFGAPSVIIAFNPDEEDLSYQNSFRIQMNDDFIKARKNIHNGVTNFSVQYPFPLFNCENATDYEPVIILKNSNITKIYESDNCITIEANNAEYFKIRDIIAQYIFGFISA
ncbi:hypothetical protein HOD20_04335 [archaeon]|jgi:hypothetical protein|nr:hypothetical protein [archaeon]MBT4351733.1 hypothetical protein [archaeon]MBT4646758.1 hypothetical protein [archaeon]MBT6822051.1 hypothetical protein [archaeon]MBT7391437.1 hypothetical protein [archaeon]